MPVVKFGGRRLLLSASDLVLPLCCGTVLHLFFVISLCVTHYFLPTVNCTHIIYWFIYFALLCHGSIVIINCIGTYIGLVVKVLQYSVCLTRVLYIRTALNIMDVSIALWSVALLCVGDLNCLETKPYTLLIACVMINWIILLIGCCGVCCLSSSQRNDAIDEKETSLHTKEESHRIRASSVRNSTPDKLESKLRTICCACLWEKRAWNNGEVGVAFNEMTAMMEMLMHTEHINNEHVHNLAPSDIFTGLQLFRMLQKHYQIHDFGLYHPYAANNYTHKFVNETTKHEDILLEIATSTKKKLKRVKHTDATGDFIAMVDMSKSEQKPASIIIPTEEQQDEKYEQVNRTPSSLSKSSNSSSPESPLLCSDADGFGTFHRQRKKSKKEMVENVVRCLDNGMQPKLSAHEVSRIEEGIYYSKYAIACYGLPLYTLEYPLGIFCALPCCLPKGVTRDRIYGSACCGLSSIKVFLRRSGINGSELLCASQLSGLHRNVFFIAADKIKKKVVIAVRGSESLPDGMIDVNCKPTQCPSIDDDCLCHDGFRLSMLQLFQFIEKHELTQQFLADNPDYGIIVVGHSLGGAVSVLLTLQLLHNKAQNINYTNRDIHCYAIAPALAINTRYAKKMMDETEKHITAFIYNKDVVPRLQWNSVMRTKCAVIRLLTQCNKSSWWVYRNGLTLNSKTILSALKNTSPYLIYDDDDDDDAQAEFVHDINCDMKQLSNVNTTRNVEFGSALWRIKLQQIGMVFHIINGDESNINKSDCCSCLRCKCCTPSSLKNDSYVIYRADTNGFKDVVISSRMLSDHMPNVYKHALSSLDINKLKQMAVR